VHSNTMQYYTAHVASTNDLKFIHFIDGKVKRKKSIEE